MYAVIYFSWVSKKTWQTDRLGRNLWLSLDCQIKKRFSGLATMVRIVMMYYINIDTFFERPDEDLKMLLLGAAESPPEEDEL